MKYYIVLGILASLFVYFFGYKFWARRKSSKEENEYFAQYAKRDEENNDSERYLIQRIEEIFFTGTRNGQVQRRMIIMDLYELVAGVYMDDMELETLVLDIEDHWKTKIQKDFDFKNMTIADVAAYFDAKVAANRAPK